MILLKLSAYLSFVLKKCQWVTRYLLIVQSYTYNATVVQKFAEDQSYQNSNSTWAQRIGNLTTVSTYHAKHDAQPYFNLKSSTSL